MKQTSFVAKMKIYEAFKAGTINAEQGNYFVDLLDRALIKKEILENYISNLASDAMDVIYYDCKETAKEQGFGKYAGLSLEDTDNIEVAKDLALFDLKSFAIYISKTTAVNNHKAVMLEDIIGERIEFPVKSLERARGNKLLEEKFILLDYLKTHMEGNPEYQKAFSTLNKDIQFSCKNA